MSIDGSSARRGDGWRGGGRDRTDRRARSVHRQHTRRPSRAGVSLRWLGGARWEMAFDDHINDVDPYL